MLSLKTPLGYGDFSRHWWLWPPERRLISGREAKNRLILDPLVVPRSKSAREAQQARPSSRWPVPGNGNTTRKRRNSDNTKRRDPSHWEGGRRQKKPKGTTENKPTMRGTMEMVDKMQSMMQTLQQSQQPSLVPSGTPAIGMAATEIASSRAISAPTLVTSMASQLNWPRLPPPPPSAQALASAPYLPSSIMVLYCP